MQNYQTYQLIIDYLKNLVNIYVIEFPGFNITSELDYPVDLSYYECLLEHFIEFKKLENVLLFGHSFGGRVAIKYLEHHKAIFLFLASSAGIRRNKVRKWFKVHLYKLKKRLYKWSCPRRYIALIQNSGSSEYKVLSPTMKETFRNIVNQNLRKQIKKIACPTMILWGKNDQTTILKDGKYMRKKIKNSTLIVLEDCGHFAFLDKPVTFNLILKKVIMKLKEEYD